MSGPLNGQVALVAGATRAAGRGIALELAAAGAKVWCTGRSTRDHAATPGRPETIDETAELIAAAGGAAVAVRVDHTVEAEVAALAARVQAEDGRLDILVNDVWGGDALTSWGTPFWRQEMADVRTLVERALLSHWITARHFAPMMVAADRGLIVEVTDGYEAGYRGQILYDFVKAGVIRLAYAMAWDLARTHVTALAVTPGFLRSEAILEGFGVSEANWRDAIPREAEWAFSETPHYVGRAIAALAADPNVGAKAGAVFFAADLAGEYGFTDVDGGSPHFWRSIFARVTEERAADGDLTAFAKGHLPAAYMRGHLTPGDGARMRDYAQRLGWTKLGAGLQPLG